MYHHFHRLKNLLLITDSPAHDTSLPKIDNLNGSLHRQNCNHLMYILLLIIEYTKKLFNMTFNYVYNLKIPEEIEDLYYCFKNLIGNKIFLDSYNKRSVLWIIYFFMNNIFNLKGNCVLRTLKNSFAIFWAWRTYTHTYTHTYTKG